MLVAYNENEYRTTLTLDMKLRWHGCYDNETRTTIQSDQTTRHIVDGRMARGYKYTNTNTRVKAKL